MFELAPRNDICIKNYIAGESEFSIIIFYGGCTRFWFCIEYTGNLHGESGLAMIHEDFNSCIFEPDVSSAL